jgi:hypothetical protein
MSPGKSIPLGPPVADQRNSTGEGPAGLVVRDGVDTADDVDGGGVVGAGLGDAVGVCAVGVAAGEVDGTGEPQATSARLMRRAALRVITAARDQ